MTPIIRRGVIALAAVMLAGGGLALPATPTIARGEIVISPRAIDWVVERLIELVHGNYVLEERLEEVESRLRAGLEAGRYQEVADDVASLASRLTDDLRAASGDPQFGIRPLPEDARRAAPGDGPEPGAERGATAPASDSGLGRVGVLAGNVGYLELRSFADPAAAGPAVDAAFLRLAVTDALILDLRSSRGGRPEMVAYLLSYLFKGEPFVFSRFYWRNTGKTAEMKTASDLLAPRYTGRRVFVLTSRSTTSAAEGFCYHLRQWNRATLVGERTAGAAHTYQLFPLGQLQVAIPTGRPISPVSGGNWQGGGVVPDHETPAGEGLTVAHRLGLEELLAQAGDAATRSRLKAALRQLSDSGR